MSCVLLQLNTDHWLWFVICFLTLLRKFHMECRERLPKNIYFHKTACETVIGAEKQIPYYGAMLVKLTSLIGNWQHCCLFWYCELIVVVGACNRHFIFLLTGRGDCYRLVGIQPVTQSLFLPLACCNYNAMWCARALQLKTASMKSIHMARQKAIYFMTLTQMLLTKSCNILCHGYHQLWRLLSVMMPTVAFGK